MLPSHIISSPFKFREKQLHLEKGLHKLYDYFHGITLTLLISTEVSTAGVTRSWRLEYLQHYSTESLELVWALEGIRSKHTFYSPFIFDPRAGGAASRLQHAPSFYLALACSIPIDHWYAEESAFRTEWKHKDSQPVNNLKSNCWLCFSPPWLMSEGMQGPLTWSSIRNGVHHRMDRQALAQTRHYLTGLGLGLNVF